jgi:hypothetical protein
MKPIAEAFSSAGFRRVVLPGVVFTIGTHPIVAGMLRRFQGLYGVQDSTILLVSEVIVWGLLISSATKRVYYVYEGFAWPWLTRLARWWNERRLRKAVARYNGILRGREFADLAEEEQVEAALAHERLTDYPLRLEGEQPVRHVGGPTLLANIIASYELYPRTRYSVDGVYFWFHLLALAPGALAKEFEERYAFAESLVLTSFAGAAVAVLNAGALAALGIGRLAHQPAAAGLEAGPWQTTGLLAFGAVAAVCFYRLALPAHRDAGRLFAAAVDLAIGPFDEWCRTTVAPLETASANRIADRKRFLNALKTPHQRPSAKA